MNKYGVLLPAARAYKRKINKLWRTVGGYSLTGSGDLGDPLYAADVLRSAERSAA